MSKKKKLKKKYLYLESQFHEACSVLTDEINENRELHNEIKYLEDFIAWKSLSDEYAFFKENAFLDPSDELPFPRYIL